MYYTGIDLHKKIPYTTTVDETGRIVAKANLVNHEGTIIKYFKQLKEKTKIVIESMSSWYWLYDLLIEIEFKVAISNPLKPKAIASAKIKSFLERLQILLRVGHIDPPRLLRHNLG